MWILFYFTLKCCLDKARYSYVKYSILLNSASGCYIKVVKNMYNTF